MVTEGERVELSQALGWPNATLSMVRMLMQVLVEADTTPPGLILDALDAVALAMEEVIGDPRAPPDTQIQLDEIRRTIDIFSRMPACRRSRGHRTASCRERRRDPGYKYRQVE